MASTTTTTTAISAPAAVGRRSIARRAPSAPLAAKRGLGVSLSTRAACRSVGVRAAAAPAGKTEGAERISSERISLAALAAAAALAVPLPALAADAAAAATAAPSVWTSLLITLAETVIAWGIPLGGLGILTVYTISATVKAGKSSSDGGSGFFGKRKADEPKEYLKIDRLNDRLESYQYSVDKAVFGKGTARGTQLRQAFARRVGDELASDLTPAQLEKILQAEKKWLNEAKQLANSINGSANKIRLAVADDAVKSAPSDANPGAEEKKPGGGLASMMGGGKYGKMQGEIAEAAKEWSKAEERYLAAVAKALNASQRAKLAAILKDRAGNNVGLLENPLAIGAAVQAVAQDRKHIFVVNFPGDVQASQVAQLRQEVTAIIQAADKGRGDEVLMILNSGGGTVTGYGLAAAQLTRIKNAGLRLTIAVEQVAASGGYMMACTADRIIASPFAVLGSIGVISEQPNVYQRLKDEGIEFQTVTAGKYKRTLTPVKKPTKEDFEKSKADVEEIFQLFKGFVGMNRPSLDIDAVATGETWFGADALDRNLCDELKTVDEELLGRLEEGCELYSIKYQEPSVNPFAKLAGGDASLGSSLPALLGMWLLQRATVRAPIGVGKKHSPESSQ